MCSKHAAEVKAGQRFSFGKNWARFLSILDDEKIIMAEQSLCGMLQVDSLKGKRFLDVGSGSGLFSLAARRLGAIVHSFDYDPESVACTEHLKQKYFFDDPLWKIDQASILDIEYIKSLGTFDVVYSWGVLHHTGEMNKAFENVISSVAPRGLLFIAIYNDQGWISDYWQMVKFVYNKLKISRPLMVAVHAPYLFFARYFVRVMTSRLTLDRGMCLWHDMIDWIGGYPFEVAKPEKIFDFFHNRGFSLERIKTCAGRMGCNEFVFRRLSSHIQGGN